jgi:hypothetical protein
VKYKSISIDLNVSEYLTKIIREVLRFQITKPKNDIEDQDYSMLKNEQGENSGIGCFEKIDSLKTSVFALVKND